MIDVNLGGIQLTPNPTYTGENFILKVKVSGKAVRWDDLKTRTWNDIKGKAWD